MHLDPEKLKYHRQVQALSQADLAERAGVRQATISDAERGKSVRLSTIRRLANALDVKPIELMSAENGSGDQSED